MKRLWQKVGVVLIGIAINVVGRQIACYLNLPIWFDMTGTIIATYFAGIWGGIIAGIFNNLISGIQDVSALVYAVTSIVAAIIMNYLIKKGYMESRLKAVISGLWLGVVCTVISTPLNLLFYNGYSGNTWGDTLVDMLRRYDISIIAAALAGEAIVDIVDKQVCVLLAYIVIRLVVNNKSKRGHKGTE